ncbi:pentachlorophenol monooxygenase (plasmid) [Aminobacter sp. Y103A]|nr:pentachlorophenol monooxygenase [Aminobacter sp. SS-2016]
MLPDHTDIIIVGAGPTGMALSIALHQAGVDHLLVDKLDQGQNTSRAGVIHAHTLEALTRLGVTDRMVELGMKVERFTVRDRDRALLNLRFGKLPTNHPYLLMLPQNLTEQVLAERIAELGGFVHRGFTATGVLQDGDQAIVTLSKNGVEHRISARYVVGGDGAHSVVRQATGFDFEGATYEGSFVLADVSLEWPLTGKEVSLFFSPAGMVVVAPLPDGTFRVVATMDDAPEQPQIADIQRLLDSRGPERERAKVTALNWSSRFRLHHRLASSYRKDRLFLMGDAAHVHSPAGGQGMNTGLVDAVVLGELLGDVINGIREEAALDLYERLRRPAAEKVLSIAGTMTGMATTRGPIRRFLRNIMLSLVDLNPIARWRIQMNLSGLSRAASAQLPPAAVSAARIDDTADAARVRSFKAAA